MITSSQNRKETSLTRRKLLTVSVVTLLVCCCTGCSAMLATILILFKGTDTPAKYKFFKGKKVVVVCRATKLSDYRYDEVPRDLAREVGVKLSQNVKKIEVISQEKVNKWLKKHGDTFESFTEIGKDLEADMVLGIDIETFETMSPSSPGSYQGRSSVSFAVYDMKNDGNVIAGESLPEFVDPPNVRIAASEKPETQFRRRYIGELADMIGSYFYPYDGNKSFARDAQANE
ncbi:MAG: hypothetical protein FWC50_11390 [Planctomycetaceae bacterium]|nr:hypothetical protein [Planctomycetaceae bacterium]